MQNAIRPAGPLNGHDTISIEGLATSAIIGIHEWEQRVAQSLVIDVHLHWDTRPAAASGKLEQTLDYAAISETILTLVRAQPWGLLETMGAAIADTLHAEYQVPALTLRLAKPGAVPTASTVAVTLSRTYTDTPR